MFDLLIRNAAEVLTCAGSPTEDAERALALIPNGAVGIAGGQIAWVGPSHAVPPEAMGANTEVLDAGGGIVTPGLVDPHTHLVFGGERAHEFDLRCQGATYLEIAKAGGGIANTVGATRAASEEELVRLALPRLQRLHEQGVTTCEVKSGYGLNVQDELKMLRAVRTLSGMQPVSLLPTLLCAHAFPPELRDRRAEYVDLCVNEILPAAAEEGLAFACDAFCEEGAFTVEETRRMLLAAAKLGLVPRLHADQLTSGGGALLAAEVGASCADHLEQVTDEGIAALAGAKVSAVLVPTSTLFLRMKPYAPGRKLRAAGVNVALGTNVNPGSSMTENVGLVMGLACLENGLTAAEAVWGFTRGAALAMRKDGLGRIAPGDPADLVIFGCETYRHLPYHLGVNHARAVLKAGRVTARPEGLGTALCQ